MKTLIVNKICLKSKNFETHVPTSKIRSQRNSCLEKSVVTNHCPLIYSMPGGQCMWVGLTEPPWCLLMYTSPLLVNSVTRWMSHESSSCQIVGNLRRLRIHPRYSSNTYRSQRKLQEEFLCPVNSICLKMLWGVRKPCISCESGWGLIIFFLKK